VLNKTLLPIQIYRTSRDPNVNPAKVLQANLSSKNGIFISRRLFSGSQDTGTMLICGDPVDICDANTNAMSVATINAEQQGNCEEKCELIESSPNNYELNCTSMEEDPWDLPCDGSCNASSDFRKNKEFRPVARFTDIR
jgi:hypothetical protein